MVLVVICVDWRFCAEFMGRVVCRIHSTRASCLGWIVSVETPGGK